MSKILVLNGAPRKDGNTADLIRAFIEGALENHNEVKEVYLSDKNIHQCMGCTACMKNGGNCVQQDDMSIVYEGFEWAEVIVFASPVYFASITGILKMTNDRLFALWNKYLGTEKLKKKSVLLLTSAAPMVNQPIGWYSQFEKYNGWENLGIVCGKGAGMGVGKAKDPIGLEKAKELGKSIS